MDSLGEPLNVNTRDIKLESNDIILLDDQDGLLSPTKRQCRGLKMEDCVPTMDLLQHDPLKNEEDYKKLDKLRNVTHLFTHPKFKGESLNSYISQK